LLSGGGILIEIALDLEFFWQVGLLKQSWRCILSRLCRASQLWVVQLPEFRAMAK
jgi:hypothetical protein